MLPTSSHFCCSPLSLSSALSGHATPRTSNCHGPGLTSLVYVQQPPRMTSGTQLTRPRNPFFSFPLPPPSPPHHTSVPPPCGRRKANLCSLGILTGYHKHPDHKNRLLPAAIDTWLPQYWALLSACDPGRLDRHWVTSTSSPALAVLVHLCGY